MRYMDETKEEMMFLDVRERKMCELDMFMTQNKISDVLTPDGISRKKIKEKNCVSIKTIVILIPEE